MAISGCITLMFTSVENTIEELKHEMMEVTIDSVDPFYPVGGVFGLRFTGLPEDREMLSQQIRAGMGDTRGVAIDKVVITDEGEIQVWVEH